MQKLLVRKRRMPCDMLCNICIRPEAVFQGSVEIRFCCDTRIIDGHRVRNRRRMRLRRVNAQRQQRQIVRKTALTVKGRIIAALLSAAGIGAYAVILALMNGRSPVLDSTTTVLSVTAMILTVKRCIEQWLIWTAVNVISIIMWLRVYFDCGNSAASLLMWCIALANGIIFFITWFRDMEPEKEQGNV